jgi:hypothetical protein
MRRIFVATYDQVPDLNPDDRAIIPLLERQGIHAVPAVWSDASVDWASADGVVIRSCWDYHLRHADFMSWVGRLEQAQVRVWNSPSLLRWNSDKRYLRNLEAKHIAIVQTLWGDTDPHANLKQRLTAAGWTKAVVKPCVSASAHRTIVVSVDTADAAQCEYEELQAGPGVMVQEFMEQVATHGEWSLMFFGGEFSHAVLKSPKPGDFRVQSEYGGSIEAAAPPGVVLRGAKAALSALEETPLYARVDGVESSGRFLLMELELIEPMLFLNEPPAASERFAAAIAGAL